MQYKITGEIAQYAELEFGPDEAVWASTGSLMSYTSGIDWSLRMPGGLGGGVRRAFSGEGFALTYLQAQEARQSVLLASNQPGHITTWNLETDGPLVTTRGAFLAAWGPEIDINVTIARRAGAIFFGGAGIFLQRVSGVGTALIHGSGDFREYNLGQGESIMVSTGNLAAFSDRVDYDIKGVGGCRKILFGGEGFFMTRLTGPGRVFLQTLKRQFKTSSNSSASS